MVSGLRNLLFTCALAGHLACPVSADPAPMPENDSSGIPYAWIDAAPVLGVIQAYNPSFGFAVAQAAVEVHRNLRKGTRVAARRDGTIVSVGFIDALEDSRTMVIQFPVSSPDPSNPSRPRVGDEIIPYPPPSPDKKP